MRLIPAILVLFIFTILTDINVLAQEASAYRIERLPLNSGQFSDISPAIISDGIIFCSDRRTRAIVDRTSFDNRRLYNIYIAERKDTSGWARPLEIKSERSSLFNSGPLCIAPDGRTVYFTSEIETGEPSRSRRFRNSSGIFRGTLSGDEIISIQPFKYNNPDYNAGKLSVSPDGKYLFFASDMPGGMGGSDIYYCESADGEWLEPVNLGRLVNSSDADNYPFMHSSGRLFFSSGRQGGAGGLDVWYTVFADSSWEDPVRLSEPINSPGDDFAFVAQPDLQNGYFSSNRLRNDDIYQFVTTIIRKVSCTPLEKNNYCYEFVEENAVKYDTMPFRYDWKFGDGNNASGPRVEHCYSGPGTYNVQLDVINLVTNEVTVNEKNETLVVEDIIQPYISCPEVYDAGQAVRLSADSTNLPGWDVTSYYWNFGDETIATGRNVEKSFNKPGTYNIQLIVTSRPDSNGRAREACVSKDVLIRQKP